MGLKELLLELVIISSFNSRWPQFKTLIMSTEYLQTPGVPAKRPSNLQRLDIFIKYLIDVNDDLSTVTYGKTFNKACYCQWYASVNSSGLKGSNCLAQLECWVMVCWKNVCFVYNSLKGSYNTRAALHGSHTKHLSS